MGICSSQEETVEQLKSRLIDKELMQAHRMSQKTIKILLLGTGDCGKSTILKQMRILHDYGFSEAEKQNLKSAVYNNTVNSMICLLDGMSKLNIAFKNPNLESAVQTLLEAVESHVDFQMLGFTLASAIKHLWADKNVREKAFPRGQEFELCANSAHFFNSIDRFSQDDYVPTEQDILLIRIRTTGIIEVKFKTKALNFRVFDVGGQRSERKKWIHCFEGVNSVIFISAVSEFDQTLVEDGKINRLVESMHLFKPICNSKWFIKSSMILFLNKKDLFAEKIKHKSISVCFTSYAGENTYEDQISYIAHRFERLRDNPDKAIYTHRTCATDTNQVEQVLDSVIDQIIKTNLQHKALY